MFGPHLVLEGYGCSKKTLGDVGFLYRTLDEYPDVIGMTKIMPPHIQQYLEKPDKLWGVSGFVIIAESHIAIHTFPERNFLTLDIFSCKDFDIDLAVSFVTDRFKIQRYDHNIFNRGEDYPRDIRETVRLVKMDRGELRVAQS
jgi:S-adenosylmethionine decarboxylase